MVVRSNRRRAARSALIILAAASLALTSGPTTAPRPARGLAPAGSRAARAGAAAGALPGPLVAVLRLKAVLAGVGEAPARAARSAAWPRPLPRASRPAQAPRRPGPGAPRVDPPLRC